jgi:hypothetical protein
MTRRLTPVAAALLGLTVVPIHAAGAQAPDPDSLRRAYRAQAEATSRRVADAAATFANRQLSADERLAAVSGIGGFDRVDDVARTVTIVFDRAEPEPIRIRALQLVAATAAVNDTLLIRLLDLAELRTEPVGLRRASMVELEGALFSWHPHATPDRVTPVLRRLMRDPDPAIRRPALRVLAARGDAEALGALERGLLTPGEAVVPPGEAVPLLALSDPSRHYAGLRRVLAAPPDLRTRVMAIRLLAGDAESRDPLTRILQDSGEAVEAREAALGALATGDAQGLAERVLPLVSDDAGPRDLRVRTIKTMELLRTTRDRAVIAARRLDDFDRQMERLATEARDPGVRAAAGDYLRRTRSPQ